MTSSLFRIQMSHVTLSQGPSSTRLLISVLATDTPNHAEGQTHFFCQDDFSLPFLVAAFDPLMGDLIR